MHVSTFLPVFSGFYCNPYYDTTSDEENELQHINDLRAKKKLPLLDNCESLEFDYKTYFKEIGEHCCSYLERELNDFVESITFERIQSPREYNFSNDEIHCVIIPKMDKIRSYLSEHDEDFEAFIHEKCTSCSGFVSFYPNDHKKWLLYLDNDKVYEDATILGTILKFIAKNEGIEEENLSDYEAHVICSNFEQLITS